MTFTTAELITLVAIPFVVSIVADLCTPAVQRWLTAGASRAVHGSNAAAFAIMRARVRQIEAEETQLRELESPEEQARVLDAALFYAQVSIWLLFASPFVAAILRPLTAHLPAPLSEASFSFAAIFGAFFAAGPFQAAIYGSVLRRSIRRANDKDGYRSKLSAERARIAEHLYPQGE